MLGFSNIVKGNSKKAWDILNKLYKLLLIIPERITVSSTRQNITNTVKSIFFSDTIILYTEQDNFEDLFSIFLTATNFFFQSMLLGIPLRGGIAHGDFFVDTSKNLYMGMPLIKAYKAGEKAQWLGIIVEDDIYRTQLADYPEMKYDHYFVEWDVPLEDNKTEKEIVINWPYVFQGIIRFKETTKEWYELYRFNELFGVYENLEVTAKNIYENTQNFIKTQKIDK